MEDVRPFGWLVLAAAAVGLGAVLSNRLSERARVPAPVFFLVGAAVAARLVPSLHGLSPVVLGRLVTVALITILFNGGLHLGWARLRAAAGPVASVGVLGTLLTAGAVGALAHAVLGTDWWVSLLIGTAVAPTDPAVVFSVLGRREVAGRAGTVLEGESGANDPVGIALMAGLLGAHAVSGGSLGRAGGTFLLQMAIGATVGLVGAWALLWFMRRVALPSEALYPLRTLAAALGLYAVATVLGGSGFLAVFLAGIALGDARAPYKREIERFFAALASLGEIVAFLALGLTVDLTVLGHRDAWLAGLVLAAALAVLVRPMVVGLCLLPFDLPRNEQLFIAWAGLKGAVPILLGSFLLSADVPDAERWYAVVIVVVLFSVLVQGGSVPGTARLLGVPMRPVDPQPWALGVRLRDEPEGVYLLTISPGSRADGSSVDELSRLSEEIWISCIVRDSALLPVRASTTLSAGDEVLVLATPDVQPILRTAFTAPSGGGPGADP